MRPEVGLVSIAGNNSRVWTAFTFFLFFFLETRCVLKQDNNFLGSFDLKAGILDDSVLEMDSSREFNFVLLLCYCVYFCMSLPMCLMFFGQIDSPLKK